METCASGGQNRCVVVFRAATGVRFAADTPTLAAQGVPTAVGPVELIFRSYAVDAGFEVPIPRGLWIDARGPAPSLTEAINAY